MCGAGLRSQALWSTYHASCIMYHVWHCMLCLSCVMCDVPCVTCTLLALDWVRKRRSVLFHQAPSPRDRSSNSRVVGNGSVSRGPGCSISLGTTAQNPAHHTSTSPDEHKQTDMEHSDSEYHYSRRSPTSIRDSRISQRDRDRDRDRVPPQPDSPTSNTVTTPDQKID